MIRVRRAALVLIAIGLLGSVERAGATTLLDYVTFDSIDYIRWADEPGRPLTRVDLGPEFAVVECSFGEDTRGCPYGVDASAAFLPSGTRVYAVPGYPTNFRLAAVWRDRIFLYQAWRNPRARVGADLYDIVGRVRSIDVQRGEPPLVTLPKPVAITSPPDVSALVEMIATGTVTRASSARGRRAPVLAHALARRRHHARPDLFPGDERTDGRRDGARRLRPNSRALSGTKVRLKLFAGARMVRPDPRWPTHVTLEVAR